MILRIAGALISVILALLLSVGYTRPAEAFSLSENFKINYTAEFSTLDVSESEAFTLKITAHAVCIADLPAPYNLVSEASIQGRVTGKNQSTGDTVVLNPSYSLSIKPFPTKVGESSQDSRTLNLQFPAGSPSGSYKIEAELLEAQVKVIVWLDATQYLPSTATLGSVVYDPATTLTPTSTSSPLPSPTPSPKTSATTKPAASGSVSASIAPTPSKTPSSSSAQSGTISNTAPAATGGSAAASTHLSSSPIATASQPEAAAESGMAWLKLAVVLEGVALVGAIIVIIALWKQRR